MAEEQTPDLPTTSARDVFISYASPDKAVADAIVEALERIGLRCWIAPRDVRPGTVYADAIVGAINDSKALVLVLSANAMPSAHVGREVERAASKHKQLIAFRVDATPLSRELEYFLSNSQWIDVPALGMPQALARLKEALVSAPPMAANPVSSATPATPASTRAKLIAVTAGVLALGVAAAWGLRFWPTRHGDAQALATTAGTTVSDKSIAVLPFVDMSEKHDQEYFGDGMAEEILDLLAKIPGLTVIGRTSSFAFKGKSEDLRTIGTKLGAAYVLEGSVRKASNTVRITAQLINTRTGTHEWSETYDRPIGDVLRLQDAIAATVVRELQITISPNYIAARSTLKSAEVYDLYLRGRHAADRADKEGLDRAITLFRQALDRDPTSADAAAGLAFSYYFQGEDGFLAPAVAFEQARSAAAAALKLDRNNVLAHTVLGNIHLVYDWDWAAAAREWQQVSTLAPHSADALANQAWLSLALGRWADALQRINAAVTQDPINPDNFENLAWVQMRSGRLSEAEVASRRTLEIRPTYTWGHFLLGLVLLERGDLVAALDEMQQETAGDGREAGLAMVYYGLGKKAESDAALARAIKNYADGSALEIALVYGFRGQSDEAMRWLERAYVQKDPGLFQVKSYLPLKGLEGDPRFKAFLRKMNLPE